MPDSVQYAIKTETDTGAASGRMTGDRQQRYTEAETADAITAAEPGDYIELREQPDAEQTDFEAQMRLSAAEQTRRATVGIEAMEAAESDVSDDNPWRLPINGFQRGLIKRFGLDNEKLPGVSYNRATVRQRALCAILACPQDDLGAGRLTLTQQLEYLSKGRLSLRDRSRTLTEQVRDILSGRVAVVTEVDLNYILSQAAIVEACTELDREGVPADREGRIAYRRMLEAQANTQPQGLLTMYNALRYINMLSGPATAIRNVVGNTLMYGADNLGKAYQPGSRWESGVAAFVDAMMTPTATYEKRDDAALCELRDLSYRADAQGLKNTTSFPPEKELISSGKNGLTVNKTLAKRLGKSDSFVLELSDSERRYANAFYSRILFGGTGTMQYLNSNGNPYRIQGIRAYMSSRAYALASDEQRISDIEDMKELAKELTLSEIMRGQR